MNIQDRARDYLTHGYDKNGIDWEGAIDRMYSKLNRMDNVEFLALIAMLVEWRLDDFALDMEKKK